MPEIMAMAWLNVTRAGCDCLSVGAVAMMTALDTSDVKKRAPPVASCPAQRSEEHTSELKSLMRISYAVFCLKKKNKLDYIDDDSTNLQVCLDSDNYSRLERK